MKKVLCCIIGVLMCLVMAGCANDKTEKKVIRIWGSSATVLDDEVELNQNEWFFVQLLREYEELHPDIKFEYQYYEDEAAMQQNIKNAVIGGTEPDIVNLWTGPYLKDLENILLPLNDYIPQDDLDHVLYWDFVTDNMRNPSEGGKILGYPFGGGEVGLILYNKKIVKEVGLDFEGNPPTTVKDFMNALEVIKNAGYLPMACSDYGTNYIVNLVFNKWWVQVEGIDHLRDLASGKEKFVEDQHFLYLYTILSEMYQNGYITADYATNEDSYMDFFNGKAALYPSGNWDIRLSQEYLGEQVGILEIPDVSEDVAISGYLTGGSGQSLCVLNSTKHAEECAEFLSWLSNKENTIRISERKSVLPLRKDVTLTDIKKESDILYAKTRAMLERTIPWHEYYMDPEVADVYYRFGTAAITQRVSVQDFAMMMDEAVEESNK